MPIQARAIWCSVGLLCRRLLCLCRNQGGADSHHCALVRALDKGQFEPAQRFPFVGFVIDTLDELVYIPEDKVGKYEKHIGKLLQKDSTTPLEVASVVGKVVSTMRAFAPALMHVRSSYEEISKHVVGSQGWLLPIKMTETMRDDFSWLKENLRARNGRFLWRPAGIYILATDAAKHSGAGWGATLRAGKQLLMAQGTWGETDLQLHIHTLEMLAVWHALHAFQHTLRGHVFQVITDNTVCHATLQKGSRKTDILKLVKQIHDFACSIDATMVDVMWIPSEENTIPDFLSRHVAGQWPPQCGHSFATNGPTCRWTGSLPARTPSCAATTQGGGTPAGNPTTPWPRHGQARFRTHAHQWQ